MTDKMTPSEVLAVMDEEIWYLNEDNFPARAEGLEQARAAVAELASEVDRLKTRLSAEENAHAELQARCFDSGMPTHTSIFDTVTALRRRVEELEKANKSILGIIALGADET